MAVCENCGKKTVIGSSQKHRRGVAGKRWQKRVTKTPRMFKVNIQNVTVIENGQEKKMKLCGKCIKRFRREKKLKSQQIRTSGNPV